MKDSDEMPNDDVPVMNDALIPSEAEPVAPAADALENFEKEGLPAGYSPAHDKGLAKSTEGQEGALPGAEPEQPAAESSGTQSLPVGDVGEQTPSPEPTQTQAGMIQPDGGAWFSEIVSFEEAQPAAPRPATEVNSSPTATPQAAAALPEKPVGITSGDDIPTLPPEVAQTPAPEPLPRLVAQVDPNATTLTPSAFAPMAPVAQVSPKPVAPHATKKNEHTYPLQVNQPGNGGKKANGTGKPVHKKKRGCLGRTLLITLIALLLVGAGLAGFAIYKYFQIASTLPDVQELRNKASQFETTRILDRNGNLLYEIVDPNAGKRTYVPLDKISSNLIAATIATEDKEYYNHPGFDIFALARALWANYTSGEIVSGASTITQQLARMLLLPEERFNQSYERKAREIILAAEITRRYTKDEVLELYLNEIFYGSLSYGIEAAAETYFNTSAENLTLWQSSFLAGLPQSPAEYDIYNNRESTLNRNKTVLVLMYQMSAEKG
ncbi:MAG: transglycosylase domain-containing protein, partial [Anaerolineaceae bacterium]|nr:transglycosylase domain-containing protein [Anaerolineaceae bacterium]